MTRLDHNRSLYQLSHKFNTHFDNISNFCIWGNHSSTMFPDLHNCKINGKAALESVTSEWVDKEFIPTVQQRGAAIIAARKLSSAASAGSSAIDHVRDWVRGTDKWESMAVHTDGSYNVPKGLIFSFPVTVSVRDMVFIGRRKI
jgi:malate dehydrogenase